MIISKAHGFTFFHNPKAGGTSVRATLEPFHDVNVRTWGTDHASFGHPVDLAHVGVDEFATLRPALWAQIHHHALYCLCREPVARFYSSVSEHAKLHGAVDTRFSAPKARRAVLFSTLERLELLGHAEAVLENYELTHFRPQSIYWTTSVPGMSVRVFPVEQIADLFAAISAHSGQDIKAQTRNRRERLNLPKPLARLAASRTIRRAAQNLPGAAGLKTHLRRRYSATGSDTDIFDLTETERDQVSQFVRRFYARDYELWPEVTSGP